MIMKTKFFIPFLAICVGLVSCGNPEEEAAKEKQLQDSLLQVQEDSLMQVFKLELEDIASVVNEVGTRNGLFDLDSMEGSTLSKDDIIRKVQGLDQVLNANQKKLDDIYSKMKSNKVKNNELEKMIQAMQASIASRETEISDLMKMLQDKDLEIQDIKVRVDSMRKDNIMLTEEMLQMDEKMHEVHYVVGELKELKEKGIVTKEGGILGVGGTKKMDLSQLDDAKFTHIDERELTNISLFSKKAKLITNHPQGSYEFKTNANDEVVSLVIKDRKKFWTASDYLVIEVSN